MKTLHIFTVTILLLSLQASSQEILKEWQFNSKSDLKKIHYSFHSAKNKFSWRINKTVQTPDKENSMQVTIIKTRPNAVIYEKQINFRCKQILKAKQKYRIEFWCKGSSKGKIAITAAQAGAPYKLLGNAKFINKSIKITKKWQKVTLDFFPSQDWNCEIAIPRLMLAHYPAGYSLYFGPIKFYRLQKQLTLNINSQWQVFTGVNAKAAILPSFKTIPTNLQGISSQTVKMQNNSINLAVIGKGVKEKKIAVLFNEFNSKEAGFMQIGVSADWWMAFAVNGKLVFNTLKTGNICPDFQAEDHIFNFPVVKGRNLIAVKVLSGSGGWKFVAGKVKFKASGSKVRQIVANREWKAVNLDNIIVKSGSALDFSALTNREPAGAYGRVIIGSNGNMVFEKNPQTPIRFWSFNWIPGKMLNNTDQQIDQYAEAIARQGYNMIRLHYNTVLLMGTQRSSITINNKTKIPQTIEKIPFNKKGVDRFDYLVAALKKRGIYINLDAMSGYAGFTNCSPWWSKTPDASFKYQILMNPVYRNNWKAGMDYVLNHINPYTGSSLGNDPVLAVLNFFNEQDFLIHTPVFQKTIAPIWRQYIKNKYGTIKKLRSAWDKYPVEIKVKTFAQIPAADEKMLRSGGTAADDAGKFYIEKMTEMTKWYDKAVRELGYQGLTTQWDMIMRTMEVPVRALMPVIAQHTYFCHPGTIKRGKKILKRVGQSSSLNSSYFRAAAATRFANRPFMITEYSHSAFNRYRHERGLYFGSYAALQGWSSLTTHARTVMLKSTPLLTFDRASDPISRASEVVTALTWLRGDVRESSNLVELKLEAKNLFPKNYLSAVGDDYAQLAMLTKIGISYPAVTPLMTVAKVSPDLSLIPEKFSNLGVTCWYVSASTSYGGNKFPSLVDKLRKKQILKSGNITNPKTQIYQSDTGEITLDSSTKTMKVISSRLEGTIVKKNTRVNLKNLSIIKCSVPASIVVASLDKQSSLFEANRLLLVFSTNALNTNMTFEDNYTMLDIGKLPILMQTAKLSLKLKTTLKTVKVYALNIDGTRSEEISASISNGELLLNLNTSKLKTATPFFEIINSNKH